MRRRGLLKAVNALLGMGGVELVVTRGVTCRPTNDPSLCFMHDPLLRAALVGELAEIAARFFPARLPHITSEAVDFEKEVERFVVLYATRQHRDNTGGSGFHNAFWIYLLARVLRPVLVVESGVWKGHTSWLLEKACPDATIYGFDTNLENLEYKLPSVRFREQDWGRFDFGRVDAQKSLVFFDCHVNHARRILEAREKGFKHLLFDDNPPAHKLYGFGFPGVPTAAMTYRASGFQGPEVSWSWQGRRKTCRVDRDECAQARQLIRLHEMFPDVGGPTGYGGFSFLTYVDIGV